MNYQKYSAIFKFQYLPDYAGYLLDNKLEEFVTAGIRFCRELDLPMMRPLAKFSEDELIQLSMESNRELLTYLSKNNISELIAKNIDSYINNQLVDKAGNKLLDSSDIIAEDIILAFHIRRKLFSFFVYAYTPINYKSLYRES